MKILTLLVAILAAQAALAVGVGSIDNECQDLGFDYGVSKWEWNGNHFVLDEGTGGEVTGNDKNANWDVLDSGADGIIVKAGSTMHKAVNGTSGFVHQEHPSISHITFCGYEDECEGDACDAEPFCGDGIINQEFEQCEPTGTESCNHDCRIIKEEMSCIEAVQEGLLYAEIIDGKAYITNEADESFTVSLASYKMFAALTEDQVIFDKEPNKVVEANSTRKIGVVLPDCGYQVDLVCGAPLPYSPLYGDLVIAHDFGNQDNYCTPEPRNNDAEVSVEIAPSFPQGGDYVFQCVVDGFEPSLYYWYFGDGEILPTTELDNVYHSFENGKYTVACTATDGSIWQTGTIDIEVKEPSVEVVIAPHYPQGNDYVFQCLTDGFEATTYDWDFSDGEKLYDMTEDNVYHTFKQNGDFVVTCAASGDGVYVTGSVAVSVDACVAYEIEVTSVEPDGELAAVTGMLHVAGSDEVVSGATVVVNGVEAGVLLNEFQVSVSHDGSVLVSHTNSCDETVTDEVELGEEFQDISEEVSVLVQQTLYHGGGGSACWPGFHKENGLCVQDEEPVLEEQEIVEEEPVVVETEVYEPQHVIPVAQDEPEPNMLPWILIVLGLSALLFAISYR